MEIPLKSESLRSVINFAFLLFSFFFFQPPQYKLDPRLARLMGIHTQTRPVIVNAIWQYIKVSERNAVQFEPTLLVHVQVVCAVKEPFVHQS